MGAETADVGLRERKARRTRQQILDSAMELFQARGYDAVTVDEIAAAADVSTRTVYHYFAAKEDLVVDFHASSLQAIIEAIRTAPPGARAVDIITGEMLAAADPEAEALITTRFEIMNQSPTLLAKLRNRRAMWAQEIAGALLERGHFGGDEVVATFFGRCFVSATETAMEAHVHHHHVGDFWQHLAHLFALMSRSFDAEE